MKLGRHNASTGDEVCNAKLFRVNTNGTRDTTFRQYDDISNVGALLHDSRGGVSRIYVGGDFSAMSEPSSEYASPTQTFTADDGFAALRVDDGTFALVKMGSGFGPVYSVNALASRADGI